MKNSTDTCLYDPRKAGMGYAMGLTLSMLQIIDFDSKSHLQTFRELLTEYATSLGFDLSFQDFETELRELPGEYGAPTRCILLALSDSQIVGCVALRKISGDICEMKRLYVRSAFRGKGVGRALAKKIIDEARKRGYSRMRLDTVPSMAEAISLYESLGFREVAPYRYNPIPGSKFMELILTG